MISEGNFPTYARKRTRELVQPEAEIKGEGWPYRSSSCNYNLSTAANIKLNGYNHHQRSEVRYRQPSSRRRYYVISPVRTYG